MGYYPPLSSLISIDSLPEQASFLQNGINNIFSKLFYSDLLVRKSAKGDIAFYGLSLKTATRLAIDIPGTNGMALVFNPSQDGDDSTTIPISFAYKWPILKYIKGFKAEGFSYADDAFFELVKDFTGASPDTLLVEAIGIFLGTEADPIQKFIEDFNADFSPAQPLTKVGNSDIEAIQNLIRQMSSAPNDFDPYLVVGSYFIFNARSVDFGNSLDNIEKLFSSWLGEFTISDLKKLLIPEILASINSLNMALEFPRTILKPVNNSDPEAKSLLTFNVGALKFSTQNGFEFESLADFDFTKSEIANTGLTLEFNNLKLDLSRNKNIPEAIADGRPDDFVGVYVQDAIIGLPQFWTKENENDKVEIYGKNLLIGTGGISGTIGMRSTVANDPNPPLLKTKFGGNNGVKIELNSFDLTFQQNAIIGSNIKGTLTIPGWKKKGTDEAAEVGVTISIQNGDFVVTAVALTQPLEIEIPNVMIFLIKSVSVGKKDGRFFINLAGTIDLTLQVGSFTNLLSDKIEIQKLTVWNDGQIEFAGGGAFNLKKPLSLNIKPVKLNITAIHLGSHEQFHGGNMLKYKYIGFDGGLSINPGGIDAKGSGIKIYFSTNHSDFGASRHVFIRIQSISIDLLLSGKDPSLQLKGILASSGEGEEYIGGISFKVKKPSLSGSAAMRINPKIPAFLVDIGLELPTPILLGSTGLGIYQFRAMLGQRYVATKKAAGVSEEQRWYEYYKKKLPPSNKVGITVEKFEGKKGFSFGAGVGLSTTVDSGKTLSTKLFFLLTLPDAFLLQGQAAILKGRLGLDDPKDPPFSLFLAITKDSMQATVAVDYMVPEDTGLVLDAHAMFDLGFFFKDKSAWYINLGTDKAPVRAEIFRIFKLYSFFMLSAKGIRLGAGAEYNFEKKLGPFGIKAYAYLKFGAFMNFKPTQVGGFFAIGGGLDVKILFVRLSMSFAIGLAGEAPRPFIVTGYLEICVRVLRKNRCVKLELTWEKDRTPDTSAVVFLKEDGSSVRAINMLTEESYQVLTSKLSDGQIYPPTPSLGNDYVIPMDSFISVEFDKAVKAGPALNNLIGGDIPTEFTELAPPTKGKSNRVIHEYTVEDLKIYSWSPAGWMPYNIYQALTPIQTGGLFTTDVNSLQIGYWQVDDPDKKNKLTIMARTPVNYLRYGTPPPLEELGITVDKLLCPGKAKTKLCVDFTDYDLNRVLVKDQMNSMPYGVKTIVRGKDGKIQYLPNVFSKNRSLFVESGGSVEMLLPEPSTQTFLKLGAITQDLKISYYQRTGAGTDGFSLIKQETLNQNQLVTEIVYENHQSPIDRIVIEPGVCLPNTSLSCSANLPAAGQLQSVLNTLVQNHELTTGDPLGGSGLSLTRPIPLQYIPSLPGYYFIPSGQPENCKVNLSLDRFIERKRWTFSNPRARNPILISRSVIVQISFKNNAAPRRLQVTFSSFNRLNPTGQAQQITDTLYSYLSANAPELTLANRTPNSFDIIGNENVEDVQFINNTAFTATLRLNSGAEFNFNEIVSFTNIRPDTSISREGLNYNFIITATMLGGGQADLKGNTTCFPITCCEGPTVQYLNSVCTAVTQQLTSLQNQLTELNQQIQINETLCNTLPSECASEGQRYCYEATRLKEIRTQLQIQITQLIQYQTFYCGSGAVCSGMTPVYPCGVFVFGMCFMGWVNFNYNAAIPSFSNLQTSTNAMVEAIEKPIQPLWRPDTTFGLVLTIKDKVRIENESFLRESTNRFAYTFQTKGPVGHFHNFRPEYTILPADRKDEFRLADLRPYVDYSKSYPNADGAIVSAKPLYTLDPKLLLFFVVDYMYTMFGTFADYNGLPAIPQIDNLLDVVIRDPAKDNTILIANEKKTFQLNGDPVIPADIQTMLRLLRAQNPCLSIQVQPPKGVHHETQLPELEPLKMYTAIFRAKYRTQGQSEVLRYNFQTSRYKTFAEHIDSYRLKDDKGVFKKKAVFDIKLTTLTSNDFILASQIVNNTMPGDHPLIAQFMHPYDRLMNGVFKLESLAPAVTTEFNIIRDFTLGNPSSDYILGILVRSPEPFNDPKIPLDKLADTISIINADGTKDIAFNKIIFSKDATSAFITRSDLHILNKVLKFRFKYMQYQANPAGISDYVSVAEFDAEIDTPSSLSQLIQDDCGRTEVELNETLNAELVKDATEYHFLIEGPNAFSQTYTDNSSEGILPLEAITGTDYNRTYTVKIKNMVGTRLSSYGPVCSIDTRKLFFRILPVQPSFAYVNSPVELTIRLEFTNGTVFDSFNGTVTLQATGNTTGDGVVTFTNGVGTITIQNSVAEIVTLTLSDSGTTGYNVSSTIQLPFVEHATKFVIDPLSSLIQRPGNRAAVTVRAAGPSGVTDLGYSSTVTLASTGSVYGEGVVTIINGKGIINISDDKSEIVTLSLIDSAATGLNVSDTEIVKFVRTGVAYIINTPSSGAVSTDITVTITAKFNDTQDTNFNIGVNLVANGASLGGGVVTITNGVGTAIVKRDTAGTIVLSLTDSNQTGLNVSSTKTITIQ